MGGVASAAMKWTSAAERVARALVAALVLVLGVAAGLGWLYLLRGSASLHAGPRLTGALPLQRLAGQDRQPLLRALAAWVPAAAATAGALAPATRLRRLPRALVAGIGCFALLFLTGAVSDAITANDPLRRHVAPQLGHTATWIAAALFAGAALIPRSSARDRVPSATFGGARRWGASASAAGGRRPRPA
jgi:hypothetical protein